jgi:hypothetical protein
LGGEGRNGPAPPKLTATSGPRSGPTTSFLPGPRAPPATHGGGAARAGRHDAGPIRPRRPGQPPDDPAAGMTADRPAGRPPERADAAIGGAMGPRQPAAPGPAIVGPRQRPPRAGSPQDRPGTAWSHRERVIAPGGPADGLRRGTITAAIIADPVDA